jgi:uncharacterized membrane protein YwaF
VDDLCPGSDKGLPCHLSKFLSFFGSLALFGKNNRLVESLCLLALVLAFVVFLLDEISIVETQLVLDVVIEDLALDLVGSSCEETPSS